MQQRDEPTIRHGGTTRSGLDLVRLALALVGNTRTEQVLGRALEVLRESCPGTTWAILHRVESRRYETALGGHAGYPDLLLLADEACGCRPWLSLAHPTPEVSMLGRPVWSAIRRDGETARDPELVLGCWSRTGNGGPIVRSRLETAARMIASAIAAARSFEKLSEQSCQDSLTSLLNRRGILEMLRRERARARRGSAPLSILFLDIDGFKKINDRWGHLAGDEVLVTTAKMLCGALRVSDAVGRLGGDEFLIVLPDTDLRTARRIGRRVTGTIGRSPLGLSFGRVTVELSYGASSIDERPTWTGLIEQADRRMLACKRRRQGARFLQELHSTVSPAAG